MWVVIYALLLQYGLLVWTAIQSAYRFAEDRQSGALELLLVTPLNVQEIVSGRMLALRRQFNWPVLVVLAFDVYMMAAMVSVQPEILSQNANTLTNFYRFYFELLLAGMIMLVLNVWTIGWLALWMGLSARSWGHAVAGALLRMVLPHWIIYLLIDSGGWTYDPQNRWSVDEAQLYAWFFVGLVVCLPQAFWSRHRLHQKFRALASRGNTSKVPGMMRRLLEAFGQSVSLPKSAHKPG